MAAAPGDQDLAVVHLVVGEVGLEPFRAFLDSYRRFPAGRPHTLVIAVKQFDGDDALAAVKAELASLPHVLVRVPDGGFDIGSYFHLARTVAYRRIYFVNSRMTLAAPDWLAHLDAALDQAPGGVAGPAGSWESMASDAMLVPDYPRVSPVLRPLRGVLGFLKLWRQFPAFPNPHLRTSSFIIDRETLLSLRHGRLETKWDSWRFESGWQGLTRQILRRGAQALVVDRHGRTFAPDAWADSDTFWQGEQAGLLTSDKQVLLYADAAPDRRAQLRKIAWGRP